MVVRIDSTDILMINMFLFIRKWLMHAFYAIVKSGNTFMCARDPPFSALEPQGIMILLIESKIITWFFCHLSFGLVYYKLIRMHKSWQKMHNSCANYSKLNIFLTFETFLKGLIGGIYFYVPRGGPLPISGSKDPIFLFVAPFIQK